MLLKAYRRAGGPVISVIQAFLGRGALQVRRRRLGGRAVGGGAAGKLYRVSHRGGVGVASAQSFVNSSLAPVLLLQRRVKSVADVLEGIWHTGFSQWRWDASCDRWKSVCDQAPCERWRVVDSGDGHEVMEQQG